MQNLEFKDYTLKLLHLVDPTLPIGGYTHSSGLETFVQQNLVNDEPSLVEFTKHQLNHGWLNNDGAYLSLAFDAVINKDLDALIQIDNEICALKSPRELREAQIKLGRRLYKIFADEILQKYDCDNSEISAIQLSEKKFYICLDKLLKKNIISGFYPIIFAIICVAFSIQKISALQAFYFNSVIGVITNGVKLIPLGQMQGQKILFMLTELIENAVSNSLSIDHKTLGVTSPALDIRCMQHEKLYSRLYMS